MGQVALNMPVNVEGFKFVVTEDVKGVKITGPNGVSKRTNRSRQAFCWILEEVKHLQLIERTAKAIAEEGET